MANQTITTNTNFDSLVGLLAGEAVTINSGATLTIDSDPQLNRVLAGNITTNDGVCFIDATKVRELNFSGASVLPAIGDTLTAGSVTGQVIGVTGTTTAGSVRLRSLNGSIANGTALSFSGGKTATASSSDRVGWLNILFTESRSITATRLGTIRGRGQWYELGVSNGTASQTFQHYCTTVIPCVWVETGAGTGIYEKYLNGGARFPGDIGVGIRGKFFGMTNGSATITFGNGVNGNIPPNGARIRVPNATIGTALTAAPTTPTVNTNTGAWLTFSPSGGFIDFDTIALSAARITTTSPFQIICSRVAMSVSFDLTATIEPAQLTDVGLGILGSIAPANACFSYNGATFVMDGVSAANHNGSLVVDCASCESPTLLNCELITFNRTSAGDNVFRSVGSRNILIENTAFIGGQSRFAQTIGITLKNISHSDRSGNIASSALISARAFLFEQNTRDVVIDGYSQVGAVPHGGVFRFSGTVNIKLRNCGSPANPINLVSLGESIAFLSACFNASIARVYCINPRTATINQFGGVNGYESLNVQEPSTTTALGANNAVGLGIRATGINGNFAYGSHFCAFFTSNTAGNLAIFVGSEKTSRSPSAEAYSITGGTPRFNGSTSCLMRSVGDQIIWQTPLILGFTGFANSAFAFTGTNQANHSYEYRLDTGSGFSGSWKVLSGANLSAETISSSTGFRLQLRITCITANANNSITSILIPTNTTATDQLALYPIGVSVPIKVFQCPIGATVAIYRLSDDVELYKSFADAQGEINTTYTYEGVDIPVRVAVRLAGYVPREEEVPITSAGLSLPMRLEIDLTDNL